MGVHIWVVFKLMVLLGTLTNNRCCVDPIILTSTHIVTTSVDISKEPLISLQRQKKGPKTLESPQN